jgi:hypothetical protein
VAAHSDSAGHMFQTKAATAAAAAATAAGTDPAPGGLRTEQMQLELEASGGLADADIYRRNAVILSSHADGLSSASCRYEHCVCLSQSLRGRVKAADERLVVAQSAAEFVAKKPLGRAAVDHRFAQLEQQLMHAHESCR